jgi:hypothetical protein
MIFCFEAKKPDQTLNVQFQMCSCLAALTRLEDLRKDQQSSVMKNYESEMAKSRPGRTKALEPTPNVTK